MNVDSQTEVTGNAQLRPELLPRRDETGATLSVLKFSSQVVTGKNWYVKVELIKANLLLDIMHVRIYMPPAAGGKPELEGALRGKTLDEPIEHFHGFNY